MKIKLRRPEESDLVTVVNFEIELARASGKFPEFEFNLEIIAKRFHDILHPSIRSSYNIVLAEVAGGAIGYIMYDTVSRENATFVGSLCVTKYFRRMGVGRKLLDYLRRESEFKGLRAIIVDPFKESEEFYKILGFKKSDKYDGLVLDLN